MPNFQCRSQFTDWRYTVVTIKFDSLYTKSRFQYDRSLLITRRIEKNVKLRLTRDLCPHVDFIVNIINTQYILQGHEV